MQEEKGAEVWRDVRLGLGGLLHNLEVAYFLTTESKCSQACQGTGLKSVVDSLQVA